MLVGFIIGLLIGLVVGMIAGAGILYNLQKKNLVQVAANEAEQIEFLQKYKRALKNDISDDLEVRRVTYETKDKDRP